MLTLTTWGCSFPPEAWVFDLAPFQVPDLILEGNTRRFPCGEQRFETWYVTFSVAIVTC